MTLWFNESYILSQFEMLVDDLDHVDVEQVELDGEQMQYEATVPPLTVDSWEFKQLGAYLRAIDANLDIEPDGDELVFTFTAHENTHMPMN